jgi:hypothetical protein
VRAIPANTKARRIAKTKPTQNIFASNMAAMMPSSLAKILKGGVPAMAKSPSRNTVPEPGAA